MRNQHLYTLPSNNDVLKRIKERCFIRDSNSIVTCSIEITTYCIDIFGFTESVTITCKYFRGILLLAFSMHVERTTNWAGKFGGHAVNFVNSPHSSGYRAPEQLQENPVLVLPYLHWPPLAVHLGLSPEVSFHSRRNPCLMLPK